MSHSSVVALPDACVDDSGWDVHMDPVRLDTRTGLSGLVVGIRPHVLQEVCSLPTYDAKLGFPRLVNHSWVSSVCRGAGFMK